MKLSSGIKLTIRFYLFVFRCFSRFSILAAILAFTAVTSTGAQATNKPSENAKTGKPAFQVFYEKVYLHLDRTLYISGEDIWFSAYLVNGQSNYLTSTSNSLYVELISPDSKLVDRKMIRLDNGTGFGDFKLTDSVPSGKYRIRAYTNWMKNFRDLFVFEKEILIHSSEGIKPKIQLLLPDSTKYTVGFFPEGGSLISGINAVVGFKAADEKGNGCDVKGQIVSTDGDTVSWFESTHLGMGKFNLLPIQGKTYYAMGMIKNKFPFKVSLPNALAEGFSIVVNNNDTASTRVTVLTNTETLTKFKDQELILAGQQFGKICFTAKIKLSNLQAALRIPKSYFTAGIACLTLFDTQVKPACERIVYIEPKNKISITVSPDRNAYAPRQKVTLSIKTTDQKNQPVKTKLSLAVTDGQVPADASNIVTYLMLQAEVKGWIENPGMYFDTTNANRNRQLDLLLLVQGWRNFVWKQLKDSALVLKYMIEPGISLSGNVRQKFANRPIANANINALLFGSAKNKFFLTKTDSTGKYYLDGIEFYGNQKVSISSRDNKGKPAGWIFLDSLKNVPIRIPFKPAYKDEPDENDFSKELDLRKNILKKHTLSDTITLSEVTIAANSKKEEAQIAEHHLEGGMVDYDLKITPEDYVHVDIGAYLLAKVPGAVLATPDPDDPGASVSEVAFRSMGDELKPRFVLDHFSVKSGDQSVVYNIPMEQIERLIISKTDPLADSPTLRNRYVISIYTKPGALEKKEFYIIQRFVTGYYQAREFSSPTHTRPRIEGERPDLRTTIHWNPKIETNENGEATLTFFNTDKPATIRVQAEGMSDKGTPVSGKAKYVVK